MHKAVTEDYDLIFLDVGHPESDKEMSICSNANDFYHRCGDYATSMDTTIYNINTMLKSRMNFVTFRKKYNGEYRQPFFHYLIIFDQLSKKNTPNICLIAGTKVAIFHSTLGQSGWGDKRIQT